MHKAAFLLKMNRLNYSKQIWKRWALFVGVSFLVFFALWSKYADSFFIQKVDFDTTVKVQYFIDQLPQLQLQFVIKEAMEGSIWFAGPLVSTVVVILLTGIAFVDWNDKKVRWRALLIPLLFFILVLGELYGKSVVHHPAPPFFMIKNPTSIFPKYFVQEQFSYPSGHAARAAFLAISTFSFLLSTFPLRKRKVALGIVCIGYVALVSVSTIYLGHHWLSDIIGGSLLGIGLGLLTCI